MTKKAYLLAFSSNMGTQEEIKNVLNQISDVETWRYDMSNAFYIISDKPAEFLSKAIRELSSKKGRFVITEISDNSYGWLTPESWYLIQNKKRKTDK